AAPPAPSPEPPTAPMLWWRCCRAFSVERPAGRDPPRALVPTEQMSHLMAPVSPDRPDLRARRAVPPGVRVIMRARPARPARAAPREGPMLAAGLSAPPT